MSYDEAVAQVDETLRASGLSYIDLMLIHAPFGGKVGRNGVWKAPGGSAGGGQDSQRESAIMGCTTWQNWKPISLSSSRSVAGAAAV